MKLAFIKEKIAAPIWTEMTVSGYGDLAFPCFEEAKKRGISPKQLAEETAAKLRADPDVIDRIEATGGYVNVYLKLNKALEIVLKDAIKDVIASKLLDRSNIKIESRFSGRRILLEHTSVNPNKALHLGHMRNVVLGDFIRRALEVAGASVSTANFVEDTGAQVADIVLGLKYLNKENSDNLKFDEFCSRAYKEVNDAYVAEEKEGKDELKRLRNEILKKIETGDEELSEYTRGVVDKVLRANMETLLSQNIKYDFLNLESNIISENLLDKSESLLKGSHLLREAKLEETKGCMVLEMDGKEIVYSRQNGTRLYVAKDIAYALWKHGIIEKKIHWSAFGKNYDDTDIFISDVLGVEKNLGRFEGSITVVDVRQDDEQKVVANTVKILSEDSDYTHYSYGVVNISHNTAEKMGINTADKSIGMSGRRGYVIEVDQMISKIESKLKTEAVERKEEIDDDRAAKLSSNIIKYELLKTSPVKTITFDIDESTKLKGDTALYINYTYARAVNILKKAQGHKPAELRELEADEGALVKNLLFWEEKVKDAVANLKANVACEYVHEVADSFNVFYEKAKVLGSDRENERLAIVSLVEYVMRRLMDLIGLFKVERI